MPIDFKNTHSRSEKRAKRRKTNLILNTLIAIVIILILVVGGNIFFGGDNQEQGQAADEAKTSEQTNKDQEQTQEKDNNQEAANKENEATDDGKTDSDDEETDEEQPDEQGEIIEEESNEPNVEKVIIDPSWEPIGTQQTGGHQLSYTEGTIDWNEKLAAVAYAVDIPVDNMTVWWIERGADRENQSVATVTAKGGSDAYRVYIDWIDGEGWKPTEVKKLIENDKR